MRNAYFLVALPAASAVISRGGKMLSPRGARSIRARAVARLVAQPSLSTRARGVGQKTSTLASKVGHLHASARC